MKADKTRRARHTSFERHIGMTLDRRRPKRQFKDVLGERQQPAQSPRDARPVPTEVDLSPKPGDSPDPQPFEAARREHDERHDARVWNADVMAWNPRAAGDAPIDKPAPATRADLQPVFDSIVREVAVAEDVHRRKIIMLDLAVPGRGRVRVRVRRGEHGAQVRFRTDDEGLREELAARRSELTDRARDRGVAIARVEVF